MQRQSGEVEFKFQERKTGQRVEDEKQKEEIQLQEETGRHIDQVEHILRKRILEKLITESIRGTLLKKKVILNEAEYRQVEALAKIDQTIKIQMDKLEGWLRANIIQKESVKSFQEHLKRKKNTIDRKNQSILTLTCRIAQKLRDKKIQIQRTKFIANRSNESIELQNNFEYDNIIAKIPKLNDRINQNTQKMNAEYMRLRQELNEVDR